MNKYALRRAGGSVMVTIPPAFLKRHGLKAGSAVEVDARGDKLVITPATKKTTLSEILEGTPRDARRPRAPGWDEMPPAGSEV